MNAFFAPLLDLGVYQNILDLMKKDDASRIGISGCMDVQKVHLICGLQKQRGNTLIITANEQRARQIVDAYRFFASEVYYYPAKDMLFYQSDIRGSALTKERMRAYAGILSDDSVCVVTTIDALLNRIVRPEMIAESVLRLNEGDTVDYGSLSKRLVRMGYEHTDIARQPGEFAVRGGILDVFDLTGSLPVRIELWGDEIDTIKTYQPESQRSIDVIRSLTVYPATEMILSDACVREGFDALSRVSETEAQRLYGEMKTQEAYRIRMMTQRLKEEVGDFGRYEALESFLPFFLSGEQTVSLTEYFTGKGDRIYIDEPQQCVEMAKAVGEEFVSVCEHRLAGGYMLPEQMDLLYDLPEIIRQLQSRGYTALATMEMMRSGLFSPEHHFLVTAKPVGSYRGSFSLLTKDLERYKKEHYRVILISSSASRAQRLAADLSQQGFNAFAGADVSRTVQPGEIMILFGRLSTGFVYPEIGFAVLTESDIFGSKKKKRSRQLAKEGERIREFSELHAGDYVVHENHGIGIYQGIEKIEVERTVRDYMKISYAKGGTLYVLATQLDMIRKYAGAGAKPPKIAQLGSQEWTKTRERVKKAVGQVAQELVELYAVRQNSNGYRFEKDTVWQREFEDAFPYEETSDQLRAIEETKADMQSTKIMDRLICGDVGFGKTEIAIRAAFKAVQENKQVVLLCPTTILAQQHYHTFSQRMKDYPVNIELLCRFRKPSQIRESIERLKRGESDIAIGTHRLLSKDVAFKDLGLLVVDEEQRFGVTHKERIKQMRKEVDVLTLTATPIPRTLHMSLAGIRDMSVLEEPPSDRMPIQTYIMEYDREMAREAIVRELSRGGQVYYVYNRIRRIAEVALELSRMLPDAQVAYAHGQMKETQLEQIMYQFINGEIDVLVATTIVETGLDIPNVNTMIIHDADQMGLAQLYQLRGRIGRSNRTAYAFLMYRREKILTEVAAKRLSAIRDFSDLGSGFKIAMRDLEIRGAGNLLGAEQHGHMEAVGYDYYCKLLSHAVKEAKGEVPEETFATTIEINADAYIPADYVCNESEKLDLYQRIAAITGKEDQENILDELIDRFGDPPRTVQTLLELALLKTDAHEAYITELSQKGKHICFYLYPRAKLDPLKIPELLEEFHPYLLFRPNPDKPYLIWQIQKGSPPVFAVAQQVIGALKKIRLSS